MILYQKIKVMIFLHKMVQLFWQENFQLIAIYTYKCSLYANKQFVLYYSQWEPLISVNSSHMPVSFERHKQLLTKQIGLLINLRNEREQNPTHN